MSPTKHAYATLEPSESPYQESLPAIQKVSKAMRFHREVSQVTLIPNQTQQRTLPPSVLRGMIRVS